VDQNSTKQRSNVGVITDTRIHIKPNDEKKLV